MFAKVSTREPSGRMLIGERAGEPNKILSAKQTGKIASHLIQSLKCISSSALGNIGRPLRFELF